MIRKNCRPVAQLPGFSVLPAVKMISPGYEEYQKKHRTRKTGAKNFSLEGRIKESAEMIILFPKTITCQGNISREAL